MSRCPVQLPADASAPWRARRYARSRCQELPEDACYAVLLLTSELVTNAVVHGAGEVALDIEVQDTVVTVGVSDQGEGPVKPASRFSWPETGHGLALVAGLSDRWGVEQAPGTPGKRVWFQVGWSTDEA